MKVRYNFSAIYILKTSIFHFIKMSNIDDILHKYTAQTNDQLTKRKSHHKHDKEHKHKHSKEGKESSQEGEEIAVTGAQAYVKRGGTSSSTAVKPQLESAYYLTNILQYLQELCQTGKPPVSEDEIFKHLHIKVHDKDLIKKLRAHPHINYEGKMYSFRPTIDIADKNQLLDQLTKLKAVKTSELQGAYKGFDKDLKQLVEEKVIDCFNSNEDRRIKLYYYYDPDLMKLQVDQEFLQIWENIEIPDSQNDRESMLRELQATPFVTVPNYPSLDDNEGPAAKQRKKRASTKSTNAHISEELNAQD